MKECLHNTVIH